MTKVSHEGTRSPFDSDRLRYYVIDQDFEQNPRVEFLNRDKALVDGRSGGSHIIRLRDLPFSYHVGMPPIRERPKILVGTFDYGDRAPLDLYGGNKFFISDRLKAILVDENPGAFEVVQCDAVDTSGNLLDPYWWVDVVRVLDAVDESRSVLTRQTANVFSSGGPVDSVRYMDLQDIRMKPDVVRSFHVFRLLPDGEKTIVDQYIADKCVQLKFSGITLTPLQPPTPQELKFAHTFINRPYWSNWGNNR